MNKGLIIIIILVIAASVSTFILLRNEESNSSQLNQTDISPSEGNQEVDENAQKLIGVWQPVQNYEQNSTTLEWVEQPLASFNVIFEFREDGVVCKDITTVQPQCNPALDGTYSVVGDTVQWSWGGPVFTIPFNFVDDRLELIIPGSQGGIWKIVHERTIRPVAQVPQQNSGGQTPQTGSSFGASSTYTFNTNAAASLGNVRADKYALLHAPFNVDMLNIVNNGYDGKDYIYLSIMQNSGEAITVSSATITLTNGGSGTCSLNPGIAPKNWASGVTQFFYFVCTSGEAFNPRNSITGDFEINYNTIGSSLTQISTGSVKGPS